MDEQKIITIGIPAYHAQDTICITLSSILIQKYVEKTHIIIVSDATDDNYDFVKERFPTLDIEIIPCDKNVGPGLARQKALSLCNTDWITFIDADDIFYPMAFDNMLSAITQQCVEVQGVFLQEINDNPQIKLMPIDNVGHPWVFGRLYNTKFLKDNNIEFSSLRAMEDGEFNWKIRMTIEGTPLQINVIQAPLYLWRTGSEHSITRIGIKENDGEPLYNWDLCQVGATVAAINAIKFCKKSNPFNGSVTRFTVENMIGQYFTYIKCLSKKPLFAKQNLFNAKRFYNECYKNIEDQIDDKILNDLFTMQNAGNAQDMIGIIPKISFYDFMNTIKKEEYNGEKEFKQIRSELPQWVTDLDLKSGVLGEEGFI